MTRLACILCGLLVVGLLGLAGYHYAADCDPVPGGALVVHDPDRDLGPQTSGADVPVRFRITNPSSRPIRVLGLIGG